MCCIVPLVAIVIPLASDRYPNITSGSICYPPSGTFSISGGIVDWEASIDECYFSPDELGVVTHWYADRGWYYLGGHANEVVHVTTRMGLDSDFELGPFCFCVRITRILQVSPSSPGGSDLVLTHAIKFEIFLPFDLGI